MAKTIDDIQNLLTTNGYACELMLDVIVATKVATTTYKNSAGENAIEIVLSIDRANDCVAVEILRAFDLRNTKHREATLACLMTASGRVPLLRPSLEPEGDIRLRIDCPCGAEGARDNDVLRALAVLPSFVDAWYPEVASAMERGKFDPNRVAHINLSRMLGGSKPEADGKPDAGTSGGTADKPGGSGCDSSDAAALARAAAIANKPGAGPNRIRVLLEFRKWLDEHGPDSAELN